MKKFCLKIFNKKNSLIWFTLLFLVLDFIVRIYKEPILSMFDIIKYKFDKSVLFDSIGVILTLLSIVFTVLVLSVTLERENVYGISNREFRKLLKKNKFSLFEMIIIFGFLLILIYISINMYLYLCLIYLSVISFIYSYIFIKQEILFLTKDDKHLIKIIVESYYNGVNAEDDEDTKEVQQVLDIVITYMLLSKGFKKTYDNLRCDIQNKNLELFNYLLTRYRLYFGEYNRKKNYLKSFKIDTYNEINILTAIEKTLESLNDIFDFKNGFDFVDFINSDDITLVYLINLLHDICLNNELIDQFTKFFRSIIVNLKLYIITSEGVFNKSSDVDYNISENEIMQNDNLKKMLNMITKIIVYNVSNNKMWPIDVIIRSNFVDYGSNTASFYIIFISIYFYFIVFYDRTIDQETKDIVNQFINVPLNNTNNENECFKDIVYNYVTQLNENEEVDLFEYLIYFFDNNDKEDNSTWWYTSKGGNLNKYNYDFNYKLVCRCWIEIISRGFSSEKGLLRLKTIFSKFGPDKCKVLISIFNDIKQDLNNIKQDQSSNLYCDLYEIYIDFPLEKACEFIDKLIILIDNVIIN